MRLAFPEYRTEQRHTVQLNSQTNILCDEETRIQIVEMRKKIMERQENRERLTSGTNVQVIEAEVLEGNANERD